MTHILTAFSASVVVTTFVSPSGVVTLPLSQWRGHRELPVFGRLFVVLELLVLYFCVCTQELSTVFKVACCLCLCVYTSFAVAVWSAMASL